MKHLLRSLIILFSFITLVMTLIGCNHLTSIVNTPDSADTPEGLYNKAWQIVKDEYIDPKCNDEDWNYWKDKYDGLLKTNEDAHVAIETMLESLNDRYTRLLPPDKFAEQDIDIEAKVSGIGIQIAEKDEEAIIVSVLEATPAKKAGLKENDKILFVDDLSTKGLDLKDIANHIRGKTGTFVKLTVLRDKTRMYFNVKRDEIKIKAVKQEMLKNNISYIKLYTFISQNAGVEMEDAVTKSKGADAIILDIRSNYGGLLPNSISIANIFIDRGAIIVSVVDRNGDKKDLHALGRALTDKPLIVLINGASASASEILSGALKDHHRAILVGEKTFGKGLVQKIFDLPDGSGINMTVSKYLTPNGVDINTKGISPDVQVKFTLEDLKKGKDIQLEEAQKIALQAIKSKKLASLK